jgi:Heparinase II/III-like protein/Heparinase II/III N-terminus
MRSAREITFRLRQEAANALLALSSPNLRLQADAPLAVLPDPTAVAKALRDTEYARELVAIADEILHGHIPIFDTVVDFGDKIAWRRDPYRGTETGVQYFRRIPYLDLAAAGDHKFVWEVNRHQHLVLLAQAAVLTGNNSYSEHIFRQLEHSWAENPFQHGINWTSALEVAFRALSWIWVFQLIGSRMTADFRRRFLAELYRHGLYLEYNLSIYFSPNTHLLGESVALHALGRLFPHFPRAERWRARGRDIVADHMQKCVKDDGSYFEQSSYYHVYALDMFAFHAVLEPVPPPYVEKLARMTEFLAAIVSQDGSLPFLGDDDGGRFFHPYGRRWRFARASLAVASLLTGARYFTFNESDLAEIAMWWLGPERCATPPAESVTLSSRAFQDSGIVVVRRGPVVAAFDAGPFGPWSAGHSHSDTLSLVVSVGPQEVLIDSGTYSYMDPNWRPTFRGSAAHNTIRIDGRDQAEGQGPFRWTQKPEVRLLECGADANRATASCCYQGFTHQRTVELDANEFSITDEITGADGEHDIEQFWHLAIEPREVAPDHWAIGELAEFTAEGGIVEPAWRSRCFGSKEPVWVIVVRRRTTLPARLHARLRLLP